MKENKLKQAQCYGICYHTYENYHSRAYLYSPYQSAWCTSDMRF